MFSAALLFCVIKSVFYQSAWFRRHSSKLFKYFIWNIYAFALGLISVSRMYFACHFFHQCITGIGFGIIISQFIQHRKINFAIMEMHRKSAFVIGLGILLLCISIYYAHFLLSHDPYWTVKKVTITYCSNHLYFQSELTICLGTLSMLKWFNFRHSIGVQIHTTLNQKPHQCIHCAVNSVYCLD